MICRFDWVTIIYIYVCVCVVIIVGNRHGKTS